MIRPLLLVVLVATCLGCQSDTSSESVPTIPVEYVTTETFESKVLEADRPVLLDFTAVWCGPCKEVDPVIESIAPEMEGRAYVYKLDIDQSPEVYESLRINGVPTVAFFNNGQEEDRITSPQSRETYVQYLESMIGGESAEAATRALLEIDTFRRHFILSRDLEAVEAFAQQMPDLLTAPFENGQSTLSLVLNRPSVRQNDLISIILEAGVEVLPREYVGLGRCDEYRSAVDADPDLIDRADPDGALPLYVAMMRERRLADGGCFEFLMERGADPSGAQHLHYNLNRGVVLSQDAQRMARFLARGLDPHAEDVNGYNALHMAVQYGYTDVVATLLDRGVDVSIATDEGKTAIDLVEASLARIQERLDSGGEEAMITYYSTRLQEMESLRNMLTEHQSVDA